jgi:hypothetical protein
MENSLLNVIIIGAFYDKPESKNVLTHAHAFVTLNLKLVEIIL